MFCGSLLPLPCALLQPDGAVFTAILDVIGNDRRARAFEVLGRLTTFNQVCNNDFFPPVDTNLPEAEAVTEENARKSGVLAVHLHDTVAVDAHGETQAVEDGETPGYALLITCLGGALCRERSVIGTLCVIC